MQFTWLIIFLGLFVWIVSNFGIEAALAFASLASGVIWLLYRFGVIYRDQREKSFSDADDGGPELPVLVDYAKSFFPIFLFVLLLRGFVVEPFRIPSGSMMPTLLVGDFILVNKYTYGLRLPVTKTKIMEMEDPARGDVVVFRYPKDPSTDYIKRLVGLPGDRISYNGKTLSVNGKPMPLTTVGYYQPVGSGMRANGSIEVREMLEDVDHSILVNPRVPDFGPGCRGKVTQGETVVPEGSYFVMGDNRDDSNDSRCWDFVPEENLVGKAFLIWLSWDWKRSGFIDWGRSGNMIR